MERFSQVTKPPIIPSLLQIPEPGACKIENHDRQCPDYVQRPKLPCVPVGRRWISHRMLVKHPRTYPSEPYFGYDEGESVDQRNVQHIIEERHPAEHADPPCDGAAQMLEERNECECRTDCHQQEIERRRIFCCVQEREQGRHRRLAVLPLRPGAPWTRVTVDIESSKQEEDRGGANPEPEEERGSLF